MAPPIRITKSPSAARPKIRSTDIAHLYPFAPRQREVLRPISRLDRVPYDRLRRFSRTVPAYSAIQRITTGVLSLPWKITPPLGKTDELHLEMANIIERCLRRPNSDFHGRWRYLVSAIVDDLLVLNQAFIERQIGDINHPFWLWAANSGNIRYNPDWKPETAGAVNKYFDIGGKTPKPILEANMFSIVFNANSYELNPPSPLEVAYGFIEAWLGLSDYQQATTSKASQEWLLDIGDADEGQLIAFREYWQTEVVEGKKTPILAGKGNVKSVKLGATNDGGLYHKYCEYLLRMIALAFSLTTRNYNITEHDNRATAGVAYDETFDFAIIPMALLIEEAVSEEVVDFFVPGFGFEIDQRRPRTENEIREESREDVKAKIITIDEARQMRNLEPMQAKTPEPSPDEADKDTPADTAEASA